MRCMRCVSGHALRAAPAGQDLTQREEGLTGRCAPDTSTRQCEISATQAFATTLRSWNEKDAPLPLGFSPAGSRVKTPGWFCDSNPRAKARGNRELMMKSEPKHQACPPKHSLAPTFPDGPSGRSWTSRNLKTALGFGPKKIMLLNAAILRCRSAMEQVVQNIKCIRDIDCVVTIHVGSAERIGRCLVLI
jgi:hypothetical protein